MNIKEYQEEICKYCINKECKHNIKQIKEDNVLCIKCEEYKKRLTAS